MSLYRDLMGLFEIGTVLYSGINLEAAQNRKYNILADELKSKEVLVHWDKDKDRAYTKTGIPIMSPQDTLDFSDKVKGIYNLIIYNSPKGVITEGNTIFTSKDVEEGIINGALIYRDPKTGKRIESVRVIVPVFTGEVDSKRISELEKILIQFKGRFKGGKLRDEDYQLLYDLLKSEDKEKLKTRLGLESAFGKNKEIVGGAFVNVPLARWIGLESYGDYYFRRGEPVFSGRKTEIIEREKELIGPETYKERTDKIVTDTKEKAVAESGARIVFNASNFEFFLGAGAALLRGDRTFEGTSTISHERNNEPLGEPKTIRNTKKGNPYWKGTHTLSAGALYNINKRLSVGGSFNRTENKNSTRLNFRYKF